MSEVEITLFQHSKMSGLPGWSSRDPDKICEFLGIENVIITENESARALYVAISDTEGEEDHIEKPK
jgi:hypothetical protein